MRRPRILNILTLLRTPEILSLNLKPHNIKKNMIEKVLCETHGLKEMTFGCIHIAMATDSKEKIGFYYSEAEEDLPQIAWCGQCEEWLLDNGEEWTNVFQAKADFKMLCIDCFDEVKNNQTEIHIR